MLANEAGVDMAKLELWMACKVVEKLYIGVETYNLSQVLTVMYLSCFEISCITNDSLKT